VSIKTGLLSAKSSAAQDPGDAHFISLRKAVQLQVERLQENLRRSDALLSRGELQHPILPGVGLDEASRERLTS